MSISIGSEAKEVTQHVDLTFNLSTNTSGLLTQSSAFSWIGQDDDGGVLATGADKSLSHTTLSNFNGLKLASDLSDIFEEDVSYKIVSDSVSYKSNSVTLDNFTCDRAYSFKYITCVSADCNLLSDSFVYSGETSLPFSFDFLYRALVRVTEPCTSIKISGKIAHNFTISFDVVHEVEDDVPVLPDSNVGWTFIEDGVVSVFSYGKNLSDRFSRVFSPSNSVKFDDVTTGTFGLDSSSLSGNYSGSGTYTGDLDLGLNGTYSGYNINEGVYEGTGDNYTELNSSTKDKGVIELSGQHSGSFDFDSEGAESGNSIESGDITMSLDGVTGTSESKTESKYSCTYDVDIPLSINMPEHYCTYKGFVQFDLNFDYSVESSYSYRPNSFGISSGYLELYDSNGRAVQNDIFINRESSKGFTLLFALNPYNSYVQTDFKGVLHLSFYYDFKYLGDDLSVSPNVELGYMLGSTNSLPLLSYYLGDISDKTELTYESAGHWETSEDGGLNWVKGESKTEYVDDAESKKQTVELEEQTETQKGIFSKISDFFGSFFDNLVESVLGLFVPSESDMQELLVQFDQFFENTFGFLYYPFSLITVFFDIFFASGEGTVLELPSFTIMGYQVWDSLSFDIASIPVVNDVFSYVRIATGGMLAMLFINYLRNFFDKRFGGGGS